MKRTKFYLKEDKRWGVGDGGGNGMTDTGLWNIFVDREFILKSIKFPYPLKFCHCWLAWNQQTVSERFWIIDWDNSFVSADKHYPRKALPCFPEFWQGGSRGSDLSKFQSLLPARVFLLRPASAEPLGAPGVMHGPRCHLHTPAFLTARCPRGWTFSTRPRPLQPTSQKEKVNPLFLWILLLKVQERNFYRAFERKDVQNCSCFLF